jgi:MFS family permease
MRLPNLLASRWGRLIAFFCLYVTEGIPLGFTATAIATQLRRSGVGPKEIGFFIGWLYFPWAWKWVMGPIVDLFYSNKLGARRGWIIGMQVMMVVTLMFCVPLELKESNLTLLTSIILIHNFFCATQDVAIDALACSTLQPEERGLANGLMFAGQTLGIPLGGACVLYLIDGVSWLPMLQDGIPFEQTYFFVAACILVVTVFVALPMREEPITRPEPNPERLRELTTELSTYRADRNPLPELVDYITGFLVGFAMSQFQVISQSILAMLDAVPQLEPLQPYPAIVAAVCVSVSFRVFQVSQYLLLTLLILLGYVLPRRAQTSTDSVRVELVDYLITAGKSFFGSRVAFAALILAVIPAGAAALNLALQKTLAVELGMTDGEIADMEVVGSVIWAACCVTGGLISDRIGHLKSLAVFLVLMSIPTLWLGFEMERQGYIMPVEIVQADSKSDAGESPEKTTESSGEEEVSESVALKAELDQAGSEPVSEKEDSASAFSRNVPAGLADSFWWAVMFYMAAQGLMYGTRTAVFMQISNPAVAATQFTAYMAMMNLVTAYTSWWQGVVIEEWGYPVTLFIDASTGLICLAVLPFLFQKAIAEPSASIPAPRD